LEWNLNIIEQIISERPNFHANKTEIQQSFEAGESLLPEAKSRKLADSGVICYGIEEEILRFLADHVEDGNRTLETVAAVSTLMFVDPGWQSVHNFSIKTLVIRKVKDKVLDVAWHMQPWIMALHSTRPITTLQRICRRLRRMLCNR